MRGNDDRRRHRIPRSVGRQREADADQGLADDIASMLDAFEMSKLEEMYLDGSSVLPSADFEVRVGDGLVELIHDGRTTYSRTVFGSSLELDHGTSVSAMLRTVSVKMSISSRLL